MLELVKNNHHAPLTLSISELIYIFVSGLTVVEGDPQAPFSKATTQVQVKTLLPTWIAPLTISPYLLMLSVKQGGIKYHFQVYSRTRPGIKRWSPGPLKNTLCVYVYTYTTGWNDKIVALEKTTIPFPFNENWFSFFVADHLLVGQLCTNPKSDRNLLSCLKVTQCSTS